MIQIVDIEECGSTNVEVWNYLPAPVIVTAKHQTNGRGRQGRVWQSFDDNLAASLLITPKKEILSWIPIVAGMAAMDVLEDLFQGKSPKNSLRIKWPNDVFFGEKKAGGILCESKFHGENLIGVVVGLGLNLKQYPSDIEIPTTSVLEETGISIGRIEFLKKWSVVLLDLIEKLEKGEFESIRSSWKLYAKLDAFPKIKTHPLSGPLREYQILDLQIDGSLLVSGANGVEALNQAL